MTAAAQTHRYHGYKRPRPDHKLLLEAPRSHLLLTQGPELPPAIDLRNCLMPIRDQGQEGACSGFSTAANREGAHQIATGQSLPDFLSPAYLYGRTRIAEGTFPDDSGASIADEMAILKGYGVCTEAELPYTQNAAEAPTAEADVDAKAFTVDEVMYVETLNPQNTKQVLSKDMLITIGFTVFTSFEQTGPDGIVPSRKSTDQVLGGHGVLLCGYDDAKSLWIIRNQWGAGWGDKGYCYMPYGYEEHWMEAWTFKAQ